MKKKHPEHVNHERWLVSYADFITLLFAFFVIMYATSQADLEKVKAVEQAMQKAFNGDFIDRAFHGAGSGGKSVSPFDQAPTTQSGPIMDMPAGKVNLASSENTDLREAADLMEESFGFELGSTTPDDKLEMFADPRGLVMRLSAKDFYEPGQVEVIEAARPILDRMAQNIKNLKRNIRVEGHTDSGAISNSVYPSNWELSSARATWIVRYLISKHSFDPTKLEATAYAEYHPVASNETEKGRAKNRRIEIVVLAKNQK